MINLCVVPLFPVYIEKGEDEERGHTRIDYPFF